MAAHRHRLHDVDLHAIEAAADQQSGHGAPQVRVAAAPPDDRHVQGVISLVGVRFRKGVGPTEVDLLDGQDSSGPDEIPQHADELLRLLQVGQEEAGVHQIEIR